MRVESAQRLDEAGIGEEIRLHGRGGQERDEHATKRNM